MAPPKKNGPITQDEKDFIRANMSNMGAKEIAEELGRNPNTVLNFMNSLEAVGSDNANILTLKKREDWNVIKGQFSDEEITVFEWHWNQITRQFVDELKFTESMQLINAIKHEILGNRALSDQRKLTLQILETEKKLEKERDKDPLDFQRVESLEKLMGSLSAALEVNNKEYRECNKKLGEVLASLKANRDQRLKNIQDSKKSFSTWIARLMEDKTMQRDFGRYAAKMRLAVEGEERRLGAGYKYADGQIDRPLLNENTIKIEYDLESLKDEN